MNVPDSIYTMCGEYTEDCDVCSNTMFSNIINAPVHDTLRGKVLCPFGKGETMNQSIYSDQLFLDSQNKYKPTTWGRSPQVSPRPLARIGLSWVSS